MDRYECPYCGFSYSGCEPGYCPNTVNEFTARGFIDNVVAVLASEHGTNVDAFEYLTDVLTWAFETERDITDEELYDLCCGENAADCPRTAELEQLYPRLTRIFESVFTGDDPRTGKEYFPGARDDN